MSQRRQIILHPGEELGGYRIEEVLGVGGMAVVYRATQRSLDRQVALKVLDHKLSDNEEFRQRFRAEGAHVARLDHAHIVPIHDLGEVDGRLYMAMRYVDGYTLADRMRHPGLTPEETITIITGIGHALDAAHAAGVLHRDVKPQNILLTGDHSFLADFGIAKGAEASGLTMTGGFLGSVHYASPEQIRGDTLHAASDVYSLAGVTYECLTGTAPFPKHSEAGVVHAHLDELPPALPGKLGSGARELSAVIQRGLAKHPDDRPASASAFCAELAAAGRRLSNPERQRRPGFPHSGVAAADAGAARRPSRGGSGAFIPPSATPVAATRAVPRARRSARGLVPVTALAALAVALPIGAWATTRGNPTQDLDAGGVRVTVPAAWTTEQPSATVIGGLDVDPRTRSVLAAPDGSKIGIARITAAASTVTPRYAAGSAPAQRLGGGAPERLTFGGRLAFAYDLSIRGGAAERVVIVPATPSATVVTCSAPGEPGPAWLATCDQAVASLTGGGPGLTPAAEDDELAAVDAALGTLKTARSATLPVKPADRRSAAAALAQAHDRAGRALSTVAASQPWDADVASAARRSLAVGAAYNAIANAAARKDRARDRAAVRELTGADSGLRESLRRLAQRSAGASAS